MEEMKMCKAIKIGARVSVPKQDILANLPKDSGNSLRLSALSAEYHIIEIGPEDCVVRSADELFRFNVPREHVLPTK